MILTHKINNKSISKQSDGKNIFFSLSNNIGDYLFMSKNNVSRYEGLYIKNQFVLKTIHSIGLSENCTEIESSLNKVRCYYQNNIETIEMPKIQGTLAYCLEKPAWINLELDIKKPYDNREWGRVYDIKVENNNIIIKFIKQTDQREDNSEGKKEYEVYIAIKGQIEVKIVKEWIKKSFSFDVERDSGPSERFVFVPVKIYSDKLFISISKDKLDCINKLNKLSEFRDEVQNKIIKTEKEFALHSASDSLYKLYFDNSIYAGFPWFFESYSRDELISLKAFMLNQEYDKARKIILKYVKRLSFGLLYNKENSTLISADAPGLTFKRCSDLIKTKKNVFNTKEKELIKKKLTETIDFIEKDRLKDGLVVSKPFESWMDSIKREGNLIEIQCLMLNMYNFAYNLTKNKYYLLRERQFKSIVKKNFFINNTLKDAKDDITIRPNIFLAYYYYPALLTKQEWEKCFKIALDSLWLNFGGVSSIDKKSPLFKNKHTGEKPISYHNGDSWFFMNNICAIALRDVNAKMFKKEIDKITAASTKDILWQGCIGAGSELSSAESLKAEGALNQAWSNATFIELVK